MTFEDFYSTSMYVLGLGVMMSLLVTPFAVLPTSSHPNLSCHGNAKFETCANDVRTYARFNRGLADFERRQGPGRERCPRRAGRDSTEGYPKGEPCHRGGRQLGEGRDHTAKSGWV